MSSPSSSPRRTLSSAVFLPLWSVLGSVVLLILPDLKSRIAFWAFDNPDPGAIVLAGAFLAACAVLTIARLVGAKVGALRAAAFMMVVFGTAFFYFLLTKQAPTASRLVLAQELIVALGLTVIGFALTRYRALVLGALAVATVALVFLVQHRISAWKTQVHLTESDISTGFYALHESVYEGAIPPTDNRGGGLTQLGGDYLLGTGDGRLYTFNWDEHGKLAVHDLKYHVPLNIAEFNQDANPSGYAGRPNGGEEVDRLQGVQTWQFRTADIRLQELGDQVRLFATHHYWKRDQQCFVVRLSMLAGSAAAFRASDPALTWRTVWESNPCIKLRGEDAVHENNPFSGMEVGGRIGFVDPETILLTLGDHDFTGLESKRMYSQEPDVSYGKTLLIHVKDGSSEIFTLGHRNPQGLYITAQGEIWSTEHGPQGGDELNLLVKGANYGWPLVTYGTDYGSASWPLTKTPGRHDGFQEPIFAWVPSIGVSNLIRIEQDRFPIWKGDLMVGSLHAHALFRLRLVNQRVVFAEPIDLGGERVRDLMEGPDGRLVLWTDSSKIISLAPVSGTGGAVLFANTCGACHKAIDGATHAYGPDLAGVVGRKVAAAEGYGAYSPALKALKGSWSRERLDQFIASPQAMAPGTTMTFHGVQDPKERAAILDYLATTRHY